MTGLEASRDRDARRSLGRELVLGAVVAAAYVALARIGLGIHAIGGFATLVWPPSGVALVAMLALGLRFWPAVAVGAFLANLWNGAPALVALGIAAGNTAEAVFAGWALTRIPGFRRQLERVSDVLGLIGAGAAAPAIAATAGVGCLWLAGIIPAQVAATAWRAWWLGDAIGILIVAPLLLTWKKTDPEDRPRPSVEHGLLTLLVGLASYLLFYLTTGGLASLLAPLLIWAALRFDVRGASRATFVAGAIAVWATASGHGPFSAGSLDDALFRLQAFMALTAATFLILGAMTLERRRAETGRRRAQQEIRDSERLYRTLADTAEQLMWISDAAGNVTFLNQYWEARVGPAEAARGMRWVEWIHPDDIEPVRAVRAAAIEEGTPYRVDIRIRTREGQHRWFLARVVPVRGEDERILFWVGAAAEVHDLKTTEDALRRARDAAEDANRAKDRFLATLSHELRTPLTPVLALSSLLEDDPTIPRTARERLEVVRRNAELEARLIDDLLDLSRVAAGKLEIHAEPVSLRAAVDHALEICRDEAAEKNVGLVREDFGDDVRVLADPARLRQVFWNLVKNAVKFSSPGGRVTLRRIASAGGRVAVEISDRGSGIAADELTRIFRPFEQAGPGKGGLGLGLAISRALVQAHGGVLSAESAGPGTGATFRVELPELDASRAGASAAPAPEPHAPRDGPKRILLVEDHADSALATRELLESAGHRVVVARSVEGGIEAAKDAGFDLVLSDLGLPDGSGLDLMRRLRESHGLRGIAITGYGMEEDVRRSREAGFVDHLVKPITYRRLAEALERFFHRGMDGAERPGPGRHDS